MNSSGIGQTLVTAVSILMIVLYNTHIILSLAKTNAKVLSGNCNDNSVRARLILIKYCLPDKVSDVKLD